MYSTAQTVYHGIFYPGFLTVCVNRFLFMRHSFRFKKFLLSEFQSSQYNTAPFYDFSYFCILKFNKNVS